jgi:hypothetical protein
MVGAGFGVDRVLTLLHWVVRSSRGRGRRRVSREKRRRGWLWLGGKSLFRFVFLAREEGDYDHVRYLSMRPSPLVAGRLCSMENPLSLDTWTSNPPQTLH